MIYHEEKRDLFSVPEDYHFAQCISSDFGMGKGIAVEFNKRFDIKNKIKSTYYPMWPGYGFCRKVQSIPVYNLITKINYCDKPTYGTITQALQCMKHMAIVDKVSKIAMPRIGCGLDKLEWSKVSGIIKEVFKDTDIEILVCYI